MILLYLAEVAAAGALYGLDSPRAYLVLLAIGLVSGLVLDHQETVMRLVCGFGAGIVLVLAAVRLAEQPGVDGSMVAVTGLAGVVLIVGSLAAAASGR